MNSHYCLLLYSRIPPWILNNKYNNINMDYGVKRILFILEKSKSNYQRSKDENVPLRRH
jgi:hypothetical protein